MVVKSIETLNLGYVRLYGCRPKSVTVGLGCGLGWMLAPWWQFHWGIMWQLWWSYIS